MKTLNKNSRKLIIRLLSAAVAAAMLISCCGISAFAADKDECVCVFVPGIMGWGEEDKMYEGEPYWGITTEEGDMMAQLNALGYDCHAASVGPISSAWDRACELYAQLAGTVVDYGEAHAQANNHARYGKSYVGNALIDSFGEKKLNIFAHSFGGNTVRIFTWLMANGCAEEIAKSGDNVSDLFKGGKASYINSVNTLSSPHNGSMVADVVYGIDAVIYLFGAVINILGFTGAELDAKLPQFGLTPLTGEKNVPLSLKNIVNFAKQKDNCAYDLTLVGAAELNKKIDTVDGIYWFSFSCDGTKPSLTGKFRSPTKDVGAYNYPTSFLIGHSLGMKFGDITLDAEWLANDGIVPLKSARYPLDECHIDYSSDITDFESGVWYVMPSVRGGHPTYQGVGLGDYISVYCNHIDMINSLA